jgi:hypothetical protein
MNPAVLERINDHLSRVSDAMLRAAFERDLEWARFLSGEQWIRVTENGIEVLSPAERSPEPPPP